MQSAIENTVMEFMRESEAREWVERYCKKTKELGHSEANAWWQDTIDAIEKKRGKKEAENLRQRMNRIRGNK